MEPILSNGYSVYFDNDLSGLKTFLDQNTYSKIFFLTDRNTSEHCLPFLQHCIPGLTEFDIIEVDPGEENKNIDFCIGIWRMLLDFNADRKSLLINLGGGVVTDMGGFAASTYKRGIDFVHVPTTLLSQVDASVGGKTGIDMGTVKNIIGTFTQPKAVFISTGFLDSLDQRQLVSGFAEVIKHGLIRDAAYFEKIRAIRPEDISDELIRHSIAIKNEVITEDPFEKGLRSILNFGHTIGHAVESYSLSEDNDSEPLLHGEAIAVGMICEAYLSMTLNKLSKEEMENIIAYIRSVFPDYSIKKSINQDLIDIMKNDKKNSQGKIGFALLNSIGSCDYGIFIDESIIAESLNFYRELIAR
ncbi:MAG TPA: 3-dehydroquinate synthase [Sphingobacteriaceae bacterium]|nr:3-dehydroquinate synthase [Sphingobacteriaceae bacterium]